MKGRLRVISGSAKGRTLKAVPGKTTRPTSDRVKEAIFSIIGPYFDGGAALDLFAGTGALGIEALSRGADRAIFIDRQPQSVEIIRENLERTGFGDRAEVYCNEALKALKILAKRQMKFTLVFLDPPYKEEGLDKIFQLLEQNDLCQPGATVVVEHAASRVLWGSVGSFILRRHATYGDTAVSIYRFAADSSVESEQ